MGGKGAFLQCTSFKVQKGKKANKLLFIKSSYVFHIIVFKRKPIHNDCLMLQFYSKDKTKIAANSQGNTSTELFHGSYSAQKCSQLDIQI